METTLISTFYSFEPFLPAMHKFSANKVILFVDKNPKEIVNKAIERVKTTFGSVVKIEIVKLTGTDLYEIARKTTEI